MKSTLPCALALALLTGAFAPNAGAAALTADDARISDAAIDGDHRVYADMQARIKGLNDGGRPVRDYHLAKAQCWLDVSFHEYTRNDRGPFPEAALQESEKLIAAMEKGVKPLPMDTPLVGEAVMLRQDLWDAARALAAHAGFECAQQKAACAEVELVHAGNEFAQQQWRHANPYVQIAEDLIAEGQALAEQCVAAPAPPVPAPTPTPTPAAATGLGAQVLFGFDGHRTSAIVGDGVRQLDELVAQIRAGNLRVDAVRLIGHADRLNGTGTSAYNLRLSEKRIATVRRLLQERGIDGSLISGEPRGDTDQVAGCAEGDDARAVLEECLLPNRRVEVQVQASPR